jgi:hypothetical protein
VGGRDKDRDMNSGEEAERGKMNGRFREWETVVSREMKLRRLQGNGSIEKIAVSYRVDGPYVGFLV